MLMDHISWPNATVTETRDHSHHDYAVSIELTQACSHSTSVVLILCRLHNNDLGTLSEKQIASQICKC